MTRALLLIFLLFPSLAAADEAQSELTKAIVSFGRGDNEAARQHLDQAEKQTADPTLLARIHRQRGIIDEVEGSRLQAVVSFLKALYFDPAVELDAREHRGDVQRLFGCAKDLYRKGISERAVEARYADQLSGPNWRCPTTAPPPPAAPPPAPPAPPAAAPPPPAVAPPPPPSEVEEVEEEGGLLSSPVFWIVAGAVVVVAAGTTTGVLLATSDQAYGGTSDVNVELER